MIAEDNACAAAADQYPQSFSGAALLFPRESLAGIDSVDPGQAGRAERRGGRVAGACERGQFRQDAARDRLAEKTAEIQRPIAVRHHFGRYALETVTLAQH